MPSFTIKDVNFVGEVLISFTEIMRGVDDLSLINDQVLLIDLVPDWTNTSDDPNAFEFTWSVTEFEAKYMKIKIVWKNFNQVSSGGNRDILTVRLLNNEHFFSLSRLGYIPVGQNDKAKMPTQMPNDDFT